VNCPTCHRGNDPRRMYCGGCGANLSPVCRRCAFANDSSDRFCGGCGDLMTVSGAVVAPGAPAERLSLVPPAVAAPARPAAAPPRPVAAVPTPAPQAVAVASVTPKRNDMITADDLAELLAQASAPTQTAALPSEGAVNQDDLDKLFGAF
jgi:hypothetical protein